MKLAKSKSPWLQVRGPAGAFIATVRRLGWMTQSASTITIGSIVYDLRYTRLQELYRYIVTATEQQLMDSWLQEHGEECGITSLFLAPVRALLRRPLQGRWAQSHRARVRGLFCGGM